MAVSPIISVPKLIDAESMSELGAKSFLESHLTSATQKDLDDYIRNTYTKERFVKELEDSRNLFRIATIGERIAGYSKIVPNTSRPGITQTNSCKMERLYVLEEFIPQKIGQLLFDECLELAKAENQSGIWLNVWTGNPRAIRFYEKQGFSKVGDTMFKISATHSNPNYLLWLPL